MPDLGLDAGLKTPESEILVTLQTEMEQRILVKNWQKKSQTAVIEVAKLQNSMWIP